LNRALFTISITKVSNSKSDIQTHSRWQSCHLFW